MNIQNHLFQLKSILNLLYGEHILSLLIIGKYSHRCSAEQLGVCMLVIQVHKKFSSTLWLKDSIEKTYITNSMKHSICVYNVQQIIFIKFRHKIFIQLK